jgi:hypothetical protein
VTGGGWERNLEVRVRLFNGRIVLLLDGRTETIPAPLAWVWRRLDGVAGTNRLCAEAPAEQADAVRQTIATLRAGGFVTAARSAP